MHYTVILFSLFKWKRQKMVSFVVKQYTVHEAKTFPYAVRTGEGGVTLKDKVLFCWNCIFMSSTSLVESRNLKQK